METNMSNTRKYHSAKFKNRVALEALKEQQALAELSQKHCIHVSQIQKLKDALHKESLAVFQDKRNKSTKTYEKTIVYKTFNLTLQGGMVNRYPTDNQGCPRTKA